MSHRVERRVIFVEGDVMHVHGRVALVDHASSGGVVKEHDAIAAAPGSADPFIAWMPNEAIDDAVGPGELVQPAALRPVTAGAPDLSDITDSDITESSITNSNITNQKSGGIAP